MGICEWQYGLLTPVKMTPTSRSDEELPRKKKKGSCFKQPVCISWASIRRQPLPLLSTQAHPTPTPTLPPPPRARCFCFTLPHLPLCWQDSELLPSKNPAQRPCPMFSGHADHFPLNALVAYIFITEFSVFFPPRNGLPLQTFWSVLPLSENDCKCALKSNQTGPVCYRYWVLDKSPEIAHRTLQQS